MFMSEKGGVFGTAQPMANLRITYVVLLMAEILHQLRLVVYPII